MSKYSRFTPLINKRRFIIESQNQAGNSLALPFDDYFNLSVKFKNIINLIYSRSNTVSLGYENIILATESTSPDVKSFIDNWLLKTVPSLPSASNDDIAFASIIPRDKMDYVSLSQYGDSLLENLKSISDEQSSND